MLELRAPGSVHSDGYGLDMSSTDIARRSQRLTALFARAPMKKTFGMTVSFDEQGDATFVMPHQKAMEHALGDTHGGVIATLIDNAGWFTAATRYDPLDQHQRAHRTPARACTRRGPRRYWIGGACWAPAVCGQYGGQE